MAPSFISLPPEIISMILTYLPPEDVLRIGLTYKRLNILSLSPIGCCHNSEIRYIMIEKRNLASPVSSSIIMSLASSAQELNIHPFALSSFDILLNLRRSPLGAEWKASSESLQSIIPFILIPIAACKLQVGGLNISARLLTRDVRCIIPSLLPPRLRCSSSLTQRPALYDFTSETCIFGGNLKNVTIPLLKRLAFVMEEYEEKDLKDFLLRHAKTLVTVDLGSFMTKNPIKKRPIVQFVIEELQVPCLLGVEKNGSDHHEALHCRDDDDDAGLWN
ncbi:hypothetical protein FOQG_16873 [Fusarium oxysporum f. sp. raphani 54005]|uniref:F-box domain-containing protein n=2 Tax=Fusarium oxysporum TaxID=5507 RepID=X0C6U0_FUSOX|nr:hypothetical protein FOMG_17591 [Fusarium oxysporum f. sp. melonis 26406]EXK78447.1 hypothetical protein FOQG_16873 [Fusarium oxysporum f. sp. raphani 54005]